MDYKLMSEAIEAAKAYDLKIHEALNFLVNKVKELEDRIAILEECEREYRQGLEDEMMVDEEQMEYIEAIDAVDAIVGRIG